VQREGVGDPARAPLASEVSGGLGPPGRQSGRVVEVAELDRVRVVALVEVEAPQQLAVEVVGLRDELWSTEHGCLLSDCC
jgi:hypothetical protein